MAADADADKNGEDKDEAGDTRGVGVSSSCTSCAITNGAGISSPPSFSSLARTSGTGSSSLAAEGVITNGIGADDGCDCGCGCGCGV